MTSTDPGKDSGTLDSLLYQIYATYVDVSSGLCAMSSFSSMPEQLRGEQLQGQQLQEQHMEPRDAYEEILIKCDLMRREFSEARLSQKLCKRDGEQCLCLCGCQSCRLIRIRIQSTAIVSVFLKRIISTVQGILLKCNNGDRTKSWLSDLVRSLRKMFQKVSDCIEKLVRWIPAAFAE